MITHMAPKNGRMAREVSLSCFILCRLIGWVAFYGDEA